MYKACLLPLIAGLLIFVIPAWADETPLAGSSPPAKVDLLPSSAIGVNPAAAVLPAQDIASSVEIFSGTLVDTLPLVSMDLPAFASPLRVELMLEENFVGLDSIDGVGLMISW